MSNEGERGEARETVLNYFEAYKKGDFKTFRSLLDDKGRFGHGELSADAYVESVRKVPQWREVSLVSSVFAGDSGAIMYDGTDSQTGQKMQATEFLEVRGGRISSVRGSMVALTDRDAALRFAMLSVPI